MNEDFLALEELEGVIIGGRVLQRRICKGDYLNYEIKDKIIATVDTSYTGNLVLGK